MAKKKAEEEQVKDEKKVKGKPSKKETYYYLGPTLEPGVLEKGMRFRGGVPGEVEELKKSHPLIASLIVTKDRYLESNRELKIKNSRMRTIYNKVLTGGE